MTESKVETKNFMAETNTDRQLVRGEHEKLTTGFVKNCHWNGVRGCQEWCGPRHSFWCTPFLWHGGHNPWSCPRGKSGAGGMANLGPPQTVLTRTGVGLLPLERVSKEMSPPPIQEDEGERTDDITSLSQPLPVLPSLENHSIPLSLYATLSWISVTWIMCIKKAGTTRTNTAETFLTEPFTPILQSSSYPWAYKTQLISHTSRLHQSPSKFWSDTK